MPCHFSGSGRSAFVITDHDSTPTVTSPVRVRNSRPLACTKSPRSSSASASNASPSASCRSWSWMRQDALGDAFEALSLLDLGDFVQASGRLFRTRTGEITVGVESWSVITKALRPLPEKWHGITDTETRYRQRYLDLIANERSREIARRRADVIAAVRQFFHARGFIEVDQQLRTAEPTIFAIGDVNEIALANKAPHPKAGIFAEAQGKTVASVIAAEINKSLSTAGYDGKGYCFVETGGKQAATIQGDFFNAAGPRSEIFAPSVKAYNDKLEFERTRLAQWFGTPNSVKGKIP